MTTNQNQSYIKPLAFVVGICFMFSMLSPANDKSQSNKIEVKSLPESKPVDLAPPTPVCDWKRPTELEVPLVYQYGISMDKQIHQGLDYTPNDYANMHKQYEVYATNAGTVTNGDYSVPDHSGKSNKNRGFGNFIAIDHGEYISYYAHLAYNSSNLSVGDKVTAGQLIGKIGDTGYQNGAHLHFQIERKGQKPEFGDWQFGAIDPKKLNKNCYE